MKKTKNESKGFYSLLTASSISSVGDGIRTLIIPLIVLYLTGSSFIFGIILSLEFLVWLVSSVFSGYIVDKTNRVNNLVYSNLILGILMGAVAFLYFIASSHFIYFLVMAIVGVSIGESFFNPASFSLLPDIVKDALSQRNALLSMFVNASLIGGYLIAGFGFYVIPWGYLFGIDAISFLFASGIVYFGLARYSKFEKVEKIQFIKDTKEAVEFIKKERVILYTLFFGVLFNLLLSGMAVVVPTIAVKNTGAYSLSFFYIAELLGMVAGGGIILARKRKSKLLSYLAIGSIGESLVMLFTSFVLSFPIGIIIFAMAIILFLKGLFSETINLPYRVWYQKLVPRDIRAKVNNIKDVFLTIPMLVALPMMGYLLDNFSNLFVVFIFGFFALLISIVEYIILSKVFKKAHNLSVW